jgi:periplasmic protein TonB
MVDSANHRFAEERRSAMAYTDIDQGGVRPMGVTISVLINVGGATAALFLGTTVVDAVKDPVLRIFAVPRQIEDVPPPKPADQVQKQDKKKLVIPPSENRDTGQTSNNDLVVEADDDFMGASLDSGTSDVGEIQPPRPDPVIDPPLPNPILRIARPDPRYSSALQPEYPPSEIRAGNEGFVTLSVLVGEDGRVKDVRVLSAASETFAEATRRHALRKWRFLPATRDGSPYESWREMTVRFQMPKG